MSEADDGEHWNELNVSDPVAHIVTDPKGKRRVTLATQYDPMASSFWINGEMPEGYSVTPLYASPQPVTKPSMGGGWMPIETAPKDGTWIDVWVINPDRTGGGSRAADVRWSDDAWRETNGFSVEGFFDAATNIPLIRVSHWMPLPAPPATTGGEEL